MIRSTKGAPRAREQENKGDNVTFESQSKRGTEQENKPDIVRFESRRALRARRHGCQISTGLPRQKDDPEHRPRPPHPNFKMEIADHGPEKARRHSGLLHARPLPEYTPRGMSARRRPLPPGPLANITG